MHTRTTYAHIENMYINVYFFKKKNELNLYVYIVLLSFLLLYFSAIFSIHLKKISQKFRGNEKVFNESIFEDDEKMEK